MKPSLNKNQTKQFIMKKLFLTLISLCLMASAWAYDFTSGGIYYNITSATSPYTVAVTYATTSFNSYSGAVTIPSSVTYNSISYSVTRVATAAFMNCTSLSSVIIPSSVTTVEMEAFQGCSGLTSVNIPSSVTSIESAAFQGCSGLTSFTFPSQLTSITSGVLMYCTGLTSVTIPISVTSIISSAFDGCSKLTSVSIPSSVTALGDVAFMSCSALTSISVNKATPISLSSSANIFLGVNKSTCILHVPAGSKTAYSSALYWKDFTNIVEDLPAATFNAKASNFKISTENGKAVISGLSQGTSLAVYNLQGTAIYDQKATAETVSVNLPARGVYVVKVGAESVKVLY